MISVTPFAAIPRVPMRGYIRLRIVGTSLRGGRGLLAFAPPPAVGRGTACRPNSAWLRVGRVWEKQEWRA